MITAGVIILAALAACAIMYRIGRNEGHSRGTDEGYQLGLQAGRNEPLDKIQAELDKATADLKDVEAALTAAKSKLSSLERAATEKRAELNRELQRLEPITVRLERINKMKTTIANLERQIPEAEASLEHTSTTIYQLRTAEARSGYRPQPGQPTLHGPEINVLSNKALDQQERIADLQRQLAGAQTILTDLIDDLAAKRADLLPVETDTTTR